MSARDDLAQIIISADWGARAESIADAILAAGYYRPQVTTEWGVKSPWGCNPSADGDTAETIVRNMREGGHGAHLVWRGVTKWQVAE